MVGDGILEGASRLGRGPKWLETGGGDVWFHRLPLVVFGRQNRRRQVLWLASFIDGGFFAGFTFDG